MLAPHVILIHREIKSAYQKGEFNGLDNIRLTKDFLGLIRGSGVLEKENLVTGKD
jgi:hypothetical protein